MKLLITGAEFLTYGGQTVKVRLTPTAIERGKYRNYKERLADTYSARTQQQPDPIVSCTRLISSEIE